MPRYEIETARVQCPQCWETIELQIDSSAGTTSYSEDCSVCCNPMTVYLRVDEDTGRFEVDVEAE